jgi:hypothetical protein
MLERFAMMGEVLTGNPFPLRASIEDFQNDGDQCLSASSGPRACSTTLFWLVTPARLGPI